MNEDREQAFDDFLETRACDAAQQALFDALRAAFLAGWAAAPCVRQSGRRTGNGSASLRLSSLVQKEEGVYGRNMVPPVRSRAAPAGECRRPIFGNSFAGNL